MRVYDAVVNSGEDTDGFVPFSGLSCAYTVDDSVSRQELTPGVGGGVLEDDMGVLDLVNFWSQHGEETIDHFKDLLATTSFEGQHLYNIYFYNLADQLPEMFISQDAEAGLTIRLSFHNVSIEAISTQPTLFGSWADPLVRLSFDLTLDVKLNQIRSPPT